MTTHTAVDPGTRQSLPSASMSAYSPGVKATIIFFVRRNTSSAAGQSLKCLALFVATKLFTQKEYTPSIYTQKNLAIKTF